MADGEQDCLDIVAVDNYSIWSMTYLRIAYTGQNTPPVYTQLGTQVLFLGPWTLMQGYLGQLARRRSSCTQ